MDVPMVIESHPRLDDGSPFPTLYWLTCPLLNRRISKLESEGWMSTYNDGLTAPVRERQAGALARYKARRDELEVIEDSGGPPGGGPDRIKCAHAHVAHQLVQGGNPAGAATLAAVGFPDCRDCCFSAP